MAEHIVKIQEAYYINHNMKRFVVEKPEGYHFIPGQATKIAINQPEWKEKFRPFSFTSLNEWPMLEFNIKIYDERNSVTKQLGKTNAGQELIINDAFGAIQYKGPGMFLAGGAGITPFIAILRQLYRDYQVDGNKLIVSNRYAEDIILDEEFRKMLGDNYVHILTREGIVGFVSERINRDFLIDNVHDFNTNFYVCGPTKFVKDVCDLLMDLGAQPEKLIFEKEFE